MVCVPLYSERERYLEKQHATRSYVEEFKRQRESWKEKERQRMEEENRRIMEFSKLQSQREGARMEAKREVEEARSRVQKEVRCL